MNWFELLTSDTAKIRPLRQRYFGLEQIRSRRRSNGSEFRWRRLSHPECIGRHIPRSWPGYQPGRGIAWQVAPDIFVSRTDLADALLELLEAMRVGAG